MPTSRQLVWQTTQNWKGGRKRLNASWSYHTESVVENTQTCQHWWGSFFTGDHIQISEGFRSKTVLFPTRCDFQRQKRRKGSPQVAINPGNAGLRSNPCAFTDSMQTSGPHTRPGQLWKFCQQSLTLREVALTEMSSLSPAFISFLKRGGSIKTSSGNNK